MSHRTRPRKQGNSEYLFAARRAVKFIGSLPLKKFGVSWALHISPEYNETKEKKQKIGEQLSLLPGEFIRKPFVSSPRFRRNRLANRTKRKKRPDPAPFRPRHFASSLETYTGIKSPARGDNSDGSDASRIRQRPPFGFPSAKHLNTLEHFSPT
ncbi:hypothetical protein K505DRAFT_393580 [Melanomma pulvis-pyrius CBS 109.77]|uniref:Uncharacterized protein n=1 Tax=Melanomma pulvis-pyrius CBS 109.77 TaxID=1314802 RepID=A0A6A6WYD6_9PLEO|nr:hypothetical protein K505DRAFT_393580 [Melanomma pulvis-pyrius CBS 109.77]